MMDVQPLRLRLPALWIAVLLALTCAGTALAASSSTSQTAAKSGLAGKWKGHYSGAFSGHFTIHWQQTGSQLQGYIKLSNPKGKYSISGSVNSRGKIKFGAVSVGAKYSGELQGDSMSGRWTSPQGGGSWSASKAS